MSLTGVELTEPQDTLAENETVVAELSASGDELTDGMQLVRRDDGVGIVRPPTDAGFERRYDKWADARLYFGLIHEIGGVWTVQPESPTKNIPLKVVRQGKDAVAAYLLVGTGTVKTRAGVADLLDVSEQSVSNYATRVRWSE
jgi:hypothetical protein